MHACLATLIVLDATAMCNSVAVLAMEAALGQTR